MGDIELAAVAAQQEGLVTRAQARGHLSRKQLASRLAARRLEPVRWGVYRFAGALTTRWQELRAALAAGPSAVASHRSAAELWGIPGVVADGRELTVPWPHWVRLPGVRSHQSSRLAPSQRAVHDGVPTTTAACTLVDLSATFGPEFLGRLVDDAARRGLARVDDVRETYELLAGPGRRRLTVVRQVLEDRLPGYHPGGSRSELDLVTVLRGAGLPPPVPQHQVAAGGTVYVLDLAYPELRLGIEYDGWEAHGTRSALDHAAARGNALELEGWSVLHFTSAASPERVVRDVTAARARALRAFAPSGGQLRGKVGG